MVKAGYKQTEVGVIPEDWKLTFIRDEFFVQLGKMLDSEKNVGIPKPYIGNRSIQWGRIDITYIDTIRLSPNDLQRYRLKKGDLLVCEGGEIGRAAIWNDELDECYYQKALHRLRPKRCYVIPFVRYYLEHLSLSGILSTHATQTSIAHLPKDKFETLPLPLPTKEEQESIAGALSDADGLIESLEALIAKKRAVKQGAMQELLTGKRRLPGFESTPGFKQTEIGTIPKDWKLTSFGDTFDMLSTATYSRADTSSTGDAFYIHYGDIHTKWDFFIDLNKTSTPMIKSVQLAQYPLIQDGDMIMADASEDYDGIGKCIEVKNTSGRKGISGLHTFLLRDSKGLTAPGFRGYLHANPLIKKQFDRLATGLKVYGVSRTNLKLVLIPLPPTLSEQHAIASVLSDMDAEIEALEARLDKARAVKQGMMHELLTGRIRLIDSE